MAVRQQGTLELPRHMVVSRSANTGSTFARMSKSGAGIVTYVLKGEVHQGDNDRQCSSTW